MEAAVVPVRAVGVGSDIGDALPGRSVWRRAVVVSAGFDGIGRQEPQAADLVVAAHQNTSGGTWQTTPR
jgi:hypothetical protein